MTKEERNERNQHIINDIKAGMTNAQITEKYGIAERTIQRILKANNYHRVMIISSEWSMLYNNNRKENN